MIQHVQQRAFDFAAQGFGEFQVAARRRVEGHEFGQAVDAQAGQQVERVGLGLFEILHDDARGADGKTLSFQPEAFQRDGAEMRQERFLAFARLEAPGGQGGGVTEHAVGEILRIGVQEFRGAQARQLGAQGLEREFGDGEFARSNIRVGNRGRPTVENDRGQVVVGVAGQESRLDDCPRCHDPHYFAREDAFERLVSHLFADGDVVAFFDQAGEVVFDGVVGDARHRDARTFGDVARGEHDVEFARGNLGVLVKGLVEIAEAEEQDRVRVGAFDLEVLLANGGNVVGHG